MNTAYLMLATLTLCGSPSETVDVALGPCTPYTWKFDSSKGLKMRVAIEGKQFQRGMPNVLSVDLYMNLIGWSVKRWEVVEPEPFTGCYGHSEQENSWFLHFDEHTPPGKLVLEVWLHRQSSDSESVPMPAEWFLDPKFGYPKRCMIIRASGRYYSDPEKRMYAMLAEFRKHYPEYGFAPMYEGKYPDWEPVGVTLDPYETADTVDQVAEKLQPIADKYQMKLKVELPKN